MTTVTSQLPLATSVTAASSLPPTSASSQSQLPNAPPSQTIQVVPPSILGIPPRLQPANQTTPLGGLGNSQLHHQQQQQHQQSLLSSNATQHQSQLQQQLTQASTAPPVPLSVKSGPLSSGGSGGGGTGTNSSSVATSAASNVVNNMSNSNNSNHNNSSHSANSNNTVPLPIPSPSTNKIDVASLMNSQQHLVPPHSASAMMQSLVNMHATSTQQSLVGMAAAVNSVSGLGGAASMASMVAQLGKQQQQQQQQLHPSDLGCSFMDPLEMSLASFENKSVPDLSNNLLHSSLMHDISLLKQENLNTLQAQQNLMNQNLMHHNMMQLNQSMANNGFNMEMAAAMNGLGMAAGLPMLNPAGLGNPQGGPMPSMFDQFKSNFGNNNNALTAAAAAAAAAAGQLHPPKKEDKLLLKPIEDLLIRPPERTKSGGGGVGGGGGMDMNSKMSFAQNLKNASSWSSLATGSPQTGPQASNKPKPQTMDTFQAFKNRAKEKADRQKMLEQQELKQRTQKEQAEKELKRHQEQLKQKELQQQAQAEMNNGR